MGDASETLGFVLSALENADAAGVSIEGLDEVRTLHDETLARRDELRSSAIGSLDSAGGGLTRVAERISPPAEDADADPE